MKRFVLSIMLGLAFSANSAERIVKCEIVSPPQKFKGDCRFLAEKGGTFSLLSTTGANFGRTDIQAVTVAIIGKDLAHVRGSQGGAINSAWGEAKRSPKEKACWIGDDFRICAW